MSLTRKDLDNAGCAVPACGHDHSVIYLHARCHLNAKLSVCYEKATGELVIRCGECEELIQRMMVRR